MAGCRNASLVVLHGAQSGAHFLFFVHEGSERGRRNRTKLRVMLGLELPEATGEDKEWETLINETTYVKNDEKDLKFR